MPLLTRFPFVSKKLFTVFVGGVFACAYAPAQEKKLPAENNPPPKADVPVELSPFVVSTSGDIGYLAQNSLAGSRLNSKLSELAAPTTVFTQEFLEDVASTSVDELLKYMVSTEIAHSEEGGAVVADDSVASRIRGLPGGFNSINYFPSTLRLDHYNTERIDFSRGANSILFGLGSPGGIINVSSKRARFNDAFGSITLQGRSWDGFRTAIDYNRPLVKDRLAVRVAAVSDKRNSWRSHEWNDQERVFLTTRWNVTSKTQLHVEGEKGFVNKYDAFTYTARDGYTVWADAGKQLWSSGAKVAAQGIRNLNNNPFIVVDTATGIATNWQGMATSVLKVVDGENVALSDFSVLPKDVVLPGTGFPQKTDYYRASAFLSHAFSPNFNVELAANTSVVDRPVFTPAGSTYVLSVDVNAFLPNGQRNPNAGRAYTEGFPTNNSTITRDKNVRLSAAYERDFGRFFGRHILAGLVEKDWQWFRKWQDQLRMVHNPYSTASPEIGPNGFRFRTYLDLDAPAEKIAWNDWRPISLSRMTDSVSGREVGFGWVNFSPAGGADNYFQLDSAMAVLQSRFFNERLITVVGARKDWQHAFYSPTAVRAPGFGPFLIGDYQVKRSDEEFATNAFNRTFSAVYRVTKWLSLTYNNSVNSALPNRTAALPNDSGRAPNPEGRSEDIGFKVDLGQRAYLSVLYFESSAKNDFQSGIGPSTGGAEDLFNGVWNSLAAARVPLPDGKSAADYQTRANGYNFDSVSDGYEFELVANPSNNWRVFLNFSENTVKRTNLGRDAINYLARYKGFWLEGNNGRVLLDESGALAAVANDGSVVVDTVAKAVNQMEQAFQSGYVVPDGTLSRGQMKYKANLRTNYSFGRGILRGVSIGGGVRYQSSPVTNYDVRTRDVIRGEANTLSDLNLGYRSRLKWFDHDVRWSAQLNINNVFNQTKILPMRVSSAGEIMFYRLQPPREFIVTTRFDF